MQYRILEAGRLYALLEDVVVVMQQTWLPARKFHIWNGPSLKPSENSSSLVPDFSHFQSSHTEYQW